MAVLLYRLEFHITCIILHFAQTRLVHLCIFTPIYFDILFITTIKKCSVSLKQQTSDFLLKFLHSTSEKFPLLVFSFPVKIYTAAFENFEKTIILQCFFDL